MRKNYFLLCAAFIASISANAIEADTIAFWDFEGAMVDGVMDPYANYKDDEANGTVRAWVVPNAGTSINKSQARFSAYREGVDAQSAPIAYYAGMTRATTTTFGSSCLAAQSWNNTDATKVRYWYLENFSTTGFNQVKVELYLTCAGTGGPGKFRFGYKIGDGAWIDDAEFKDVRGGVSTTGAWVGSNPLDLWSHLLPEACANQPKISCRWTSNDLRADGVTAIGATSYSRLDNVTVSGLKSTGITKAIGDKSFEVMGNLVVANAETNIEVFNLQGIRILNMHLMAGESKVMDKGFYILKTPYESLKFLVK